MKEARIFTGGKEPVFLKGGKRCSDSMTGGKCPDCGERYWTKAKLGVFVHRCETCNELKKKEANRIGKK